MTPFTRNCISVSLEREVVTVSGFVNSRMTTGMTVDALMVIATTITTASVGIVTVIGKDDDAKET
jgi:hypothetical protein